MDSGTSRHRIAIFGSGRVGTAMSLEMPGVPVIRRGEDCSCDIACVCWPAQAVKDFTTTHPVGANSIKVTFCNGVWAERDGANHAGICYVRAVNVGDRAPMKGKRWRVGHKDVASALSTAGLGVICSRLNHRNYLWGKALYILPLAFACMGSSITAKEAINTEEYALWYSTIRDAALAVIGEASILTQEPHVRFLIDRLPRWWRPSSSEDELNYFMRKLCVA